MPGFVTHYLFGVDAYKRLPLTKYKENLHKNHYAFALGLQGPDLFFYYLPSYLLHKDNLGALAHDNNTKSFFSYLLESRNLFIGHDKSCAIADAYICGFMGHYALDCSCHPYVFARTGHNPKKPKPQSKYFGQHAYLETEIDKTLLFMKKQLLPTEFHQEATIRLTPHQREVIAKMLVYAYRHTFPSFMVNTSMMKQAFLCLETGTALVRDPSGQKKALARIVERTFNGPAYISPMVASDYTDFVSDPLNNAHHTWVHPWSLKINSSSFLDLYQEASANYDKNLDRYFIILSNGYKGDDVAKFCMDHGNLSFLSGLPLF